MVAPTNSSSSSHFFQEITQELQYTTNEIQAAVKSHIEYIHEHCIIPAQTWTRDTTEHTIAWFKQLPQLAENAQKEAVAFINQKSTDMQTYIESATGRTLSDLAADVSALATKAFKVAATTLLMLSNSSVFGLGVIFSFAFPEKMENINNRIARAWDNLSTLQRSLVIASGLIAWPFTLAAGAFLVGAQTGLYLQNAIPDETVLDLEVNHHPMGAVPHEAPQPQTTVPIDIPGNQDANHPATF